MMVMRKHMCKDVKLYCDKQGYKCFHKNYFIILFALTSLSWKNETQDK